MDDTALPDRLTTDAPQSARLPADPLPAQVWPNAIDIGKAPPAAAGTGAANAFLLLLFALAVRGMWFGNPLVHVDEQFYLVVGDRMLQGAVPYVDIWDRKPIGLFLIYAAIRLLGGSGIIQYQVVATLFAWATAVLIVRLSHRIASPRAAWISGAIYLLWLNFFSGQGGQSPVFYNLMIAAAGLLTLNAIEPHRSEARRLLFGCAAMTLCGLAIQIKYTALFEGIFFGLTLVWARWSTSRDLARTLGATGVWMALGLLPTLLAVCAYALIGEERAFIYANFMSIFERDSVPALELLERLGVILLLLAPLLVALLLSRPVERTPSCRDTRKFLLAWFGAAMAGFLLFGTFYDHYALPLLVSLCASVAPAFDHNGRRGRTGLLFGGLLIAGGLIGTAVNYRIVTLRKGDAAYAQQVASAITANLHNGALYVYDGEPILYLMTGASPPTKFLFPYHLTDRNEAPALGVEVAAEERRVLERRPRVIVDSILRDPFRTPARLARDLHESNGVTRPILDAALARDYRLVAQFPRKRYWRRVWALRMPPA